VAKRCGDLWLEVVFHAWLWVAKKYGDFGWKLVCKNSEFRIPSSALFSFSFAFSFAFALALAFALAFCVFHLHLHLHFNFNFNS
jgi:hypothetical protein